MSSLSLEEPCIMRSVVCQKNNEILCVSNSHLATIRCRVSQNNPCEDEILCKPFTQ